MGGLEPGSNPEGSERFGLFRFRSPLLTESLCFLFLTLLRCFSLGGTLSTIINPDKSGYLAVEEPNMNSVGFPHSDTVGSLDRGSSPTIIVAMHVLLRQHAPRHPLSALVSDFIPHASHEKIQNPNFKFQIICHLDFELWISLCEAQGLPYFPLQMSKNNNGN